MAWLAAVVLLLAVGIYVAIGRPERRPAASTDEVATQFEDRRMRFIDGRICRTSGYADPEAQRGMMMLEKALLTGETEGSTRCGTDWDIATANELIRQAAARVGREPNLRVVHGGGLNLSRIYLRYRDRTVQGEPLLPVAPELKDALEFYMSNGVTSERSETGLFDVDMDDDSPNLPGTENHQLQQIAAALLLTQVFAGESYDDRPMADYRDYYRLAFFAYLSRAGERSKFLADMPDGEKDSIGYSHVYLGDLWALRDFGPDPVIRGHAEVLIDRMLADYAEDAVKGLYTGYSGRHYHREQVNGLPTHVHSYLLFDNLGYTPSEEELAGMSGWGNWLHMAIATSDYNPANAAFPKALIDLARDKEGGYLVQEGRRPEANWVEDDFALGFHLGGRGTYDSQEGGFYVNSRRDHRMGLQVAPYIASPYTDEKDEIEEDAFLHKNKPYRENTGVVTRRAAVIKTEHAPDDDDGRYPDKLNPRLWVQNEPENRFDVVERESGWLFLQARSPHQDRDVYLAVTAPVGGWEEIDPTQDGLAFELDDDDNGFTVWEVSTSEEHDSLAEFRRDVLDNELTVTDSAITYRSSALDTSITYNRTDDTSHEVDGSAVDWDDFAHGVHNPSVESPLGSHEMTVTKRAYTAEYDWDPDDDGDFDEPPSKTVDNGPARG